MYSGSKVITAAITFTLEPIVELGTARVVERTQGTQLDTRSTVNMERIGAKELKRAACCDLSESFETNATVDVSYADAVSGTKAIKMLGLDGKYALISVENIPFLRGLSRSGCRARRSGCPTSPAAWST